MLDTRVGTAPATTAAFWPGHGGGPGGPGNGGYDGGPWGPGNGGRDGGPWGPGGPGNHGGDGRWGHDQADADRVRFDFRDSRDRSDRALDDLRDITSSDQTVVERARDRVLDSLPVAIEDLNDALQILPDGGWRYRTDDTVRSVQDARVALERATGDVRVPGAGDAARRDLEDAVRYISDADRSFPGSRRGRW